MTKAAEAPLYELIYTVLREHIAADRFPDGLVLGEAGIARAFKTSRVPASAALRRLRQDGLLRDFEGRGYLVGTGAPVRRDLVEAGLKLPAGVINGDTARGRPVRIYPEVEHTVAAVLAFGRFLLNESALAEHYGVSRAVAHDVLTRLERTGLINQDTNQRWYAGPLTPELVREHFEVRWLLEPVALRQAASSLDRDELLRKRARVESLKDGHIRTRQLESIEADLHVDIVERCGNGQIRQIVRRSHLPILATHSTYGRAQDADEIKRMAEEHGAVFDFLLEGKVAAAAKALEAHLKRAVEHNVGLLERLPPLAAKDTPPYLTRV